MGSFIGIDLGTTNSVAAFKHATVEIVTAPDNSPPDRKLTRSVVTREQSQWIVGQAAYNAASSQVIKSIKRLMGRSFSDSVVQTQLQQLTYKVTQSSQGTSDSLSVWIGNQEYEPEDISTAILQQVIANAQKFQANRPNAESSQIEHAVITIPAYFNDKQRHATRTAASRAGLKSVELLAEPTAAAISYGFDPSNSDDVKTILVYDFGGGTFDASVITVAGNQFIELGKAGDLWLGGDDIDEVVIKLIYDRVSQQEEIDDIHVLVQNMAQYQRVRFVADLRAAAEKAKIDLNTQEITKVVISSPLIDEMGMAIFIDVEIKRAELEGQLIPIIDHSIEICRQAIACAEYRPKEIDAVLLVGGSSQIPLVLQRVQAAFDEVKVVVHPEPMYAVAAGAAIVAAGLTEKVTTVSRDYFIELENNPRFKLISQGDILPVATNYTFKTVADGQKLVHFRFFNHDESHGVDESIGQMWLGLNEYCPKGTEVTVLLTLDEQSADLRMTATLKQNSSVRVSGSFSRGKADEKIYEQVMQVVSELNQGGFTAKGIERITGDLLGVVHKANQIIEPSTGKERVDVLEQTETQLRQIQVNISDDHNLAKIHHRTFELLLEKCDFLIEAAQKTRIKSLIQDLTTAIDKNNLSALQAHNEKAQQEYELLPQTAQMVDCVIMAMQQAYSANDQSAASLMNTKLSQMLAAMKTDNDYEADRVWRELQPLVAHWIKQDLPTTSVATGLVSHA
jgi:molecular chaperone DnaK